MCHVTILVNVFGTSLIGKTCSLDGTISSMENSGEIRRPATFLELLEQNGS